MQASWNGIISFAVFVSAEYGFQTYYTMEDYAVYWNRNISSFILLFTKYHMILRTTKL